MRHKFALTFLKVLAKNKQLFFSKSLQKQNITSPLTGVKEPMGALGSVFDFLLMKRGSKPMSDPSEEPSDKPLMSGRNEEVGQ